MVADLLELHHRGQHQAPALHPFGLVDPGEHVVDHRLVERGLLPGQGTELLHLELLGEVGNDRPVGLQAAQNEGRGDPAQLRRRPLVSPALYRVGEALPEAPL